MSQQLNIELESIRSLFIEMYFREQKLSSGTGFVCLSPIGPALITNRHNVTGRHQETNRPLSSNGGLPDRIRIWHNAAQMGHWVPVDEVLFDANETPLWFEHPTFGSQADFVALPLTAGHNEVFLHAYDLSAPERPLKLGPADTVSIIGFPFGLSASGRFAIWVSGFIASEPRVHFNDFPVFLVDCRSRPGQSGSPVVISKVGGPFVFEDGSTGLGTGRLTQFLGIYSGRIHPESDVGMVWHRSAILDMLNSLMDQRSRVASI
ncbi:serine protease [Sinorhizobium meliloti]|nr:serine protease [Sinorhizobium meliloti]